MRRSVSVITLVIGLPFAACQSDDTAMPASVRPSQTAPTASPARVEPTLQGPQPINTKIAGLTTFRGNASRNYYGEGPLPRQPEILWRYPETGAMCSLSSEGEETREWCGTGWTGQPNVVEVDGITQVRFGAYDRAVHILDGETGEELYSPYFTGDLVKGTVTSDPDGFPLLYSGSRDNHYRVLALDRGAVPVELFSLHSSTAPQPLWNDDWDGSGLVIDGHLLEGGENSWFYVVKLNRRYGPDGLVHVDPRIKAMIPGFDDQLLSELGDGEVSIENSVAFRDGVAYFANSGGLVQGWDISDVLDGGDRYKRVFRFWTGEDIDASLVLDDEGYIYAASELERYSARGQIVGQLMKLDPRARNDPLVWSLPIPGRPEDKVAGGIWSTPALAGPALFATTNTGRLLAVDRATGDIAWELELTEPAWSSPVVIGNKLLVGDCSGTLRAFSIRKPLAGPPRELWSVHLPGCIESTPAVWKGRIYVGARDGGFYAIGDP